MLVFVDKKRTKNNEIAKRKTEKNGKLFSFGLFFVRSKIAITRDFYRNNQS